MIHNENDNSSHLHSLHFHALWIQNELKKGGASQEIHKNYREQPSILFDVISLSARRTDLGQSAKSIHIEETKLADCIQANPL